LGYGCSKVSLWIAILAAKSARIPILLGTDAVSLKSPRSGWWWKRWVKAPVVRFIYRLADVVLVPSTATRNFVRALRIPDERLVTANYTVDNDYFAQASAKADRTAVRQCWKIPPHAFVILFCAKLISRKRPADVLRACAPLFRSPAKIGKPIYLVYAGEGPLRKHLEAEAESLGLAQQVRFLGFVNQSKLPETYAASNLLVLPSEHEPWGLVVNEAMACGVPAVVSGQVGAHLDLISPGITGEVYPVGDVQALTAVLQGLLRDPDRLKRLGESARIRIETWSYREHLEGFLSGVERAVHQCR